jgi:formylglycine-generating enzyme
MKWQRCVGVMVALVLAVTASAARADLISLEFVTVGNPGNAGELSGYSAGGYGPDAIVGGVDYVYAIGKYEVTAGQYTAFLNAVAATDTYGLYNTNMWSTGSGCKIQRSGESGDYTYSVAEDRANRPVNYVSWGDTARFMNWLHNDQPIGAQDAGTTEMGAYTLNGATTEGELMAIKRNADAKYWIPSEDEWYKAAYHKNDGVTGNYWDYPTSSDSIDTSMANYGGSVNNATDVGTYAFPSPYGTFDQGGNVWEWNETAVTAIHRGMRGGDWYLSSEYLLASYRYYWDPAEEDGSLGFLGFRVATVPEPGSITLMLCGALVGLYLWRRRK